MPTATDSSKITKRERRARSLQFFEHTSGSKGGEGHLRICVSCWVVEPIMGWGVAARLPRVSSCSQSHSDTLPMLVKHSTLPFGVDGTYYLLGFGVSKQGQRLGGRAEVVRLGLFEPVVM